MELTKGMKKALSLILSAAMVVTGANVSIDKASAEDEYSKVAYSKISYTFTAPAGFKTNSSGVFVLDDWSNAGTAETTDDVTTVSADVKTAINNFGWLMYETSDKQAATLDKVTVTASGKDYTMTFVDDVKTRTVSSTADKDGTYHMDFPSRWNLTAGTVVASGENAELRASAESIDLYVKASADDGKGDDPEASAEASTEPTAEASTEPTEEPSAEPTVEPTAKPAGYETYLVYCDKDWGNGNWNPTDAGSEPAYITGNGDYSVKIDLSKKSEEEVNALGTQVFCVDMLGVYKQSGGYNRTGYTAPKLEEESKDDFLAGKLPSDIQFTNVKILQDGKELEIKHPELLFQGELEGGKGNHRLEIANTEGIRKHGFKMEEDERADYAIDPDDIDFTKTLEVRFTVEGFKEQYPAYITFADKNWANADWDHSTAASVPTFITGDGDYTVKYDLEGLAKEQAENKAEEDGVDPESVTPEELNAVGAAVFCVDILGLYGKDTGHAPTTLNADNAEDFLAGKLPSDIQLTNVKITQDGKEIAIVDPSLLLQGQLEEDSVNHRLEIANTEGARKYLLGLKDWEGYAIDPDEIDFTKSLEVSFTVTGLSKPEPVVPTATPATTQAVTASAVTAASVYASKSLKVNKTQVVAAQGKSATVKATVAAAANTSGAAVVEVKSANTKVATATVKDGKVTIKVAKKATKGANTTVTVSTKGADGKDISKKVKVYVRNTAKKYKAAKKAITVKKGKTVKLVIKGSGKIENKKKPLADTITVKGSILKLKGNPAFAKGKITLTLKGNKKAKKKAVTIKVGSKSVKVKATVK